MQRRRRFKQITSLKDRLASFAKEVRERASLLPPGEERTDLLRRARQADTASHLEEWINSPALQPPK
jgi:hypothetical protein